MASQSLSTMENKFVRASLRPTGLYLTVWRWLPRACPPWKTSLSEPLCAPPDCTSQSGDGFPEPVHHGKQVCQSLSAPHRTVPHSLAIASPQGWQSDKNRGREKKQSEDPNGPPRLLSFAIMRLTHRPPHSQRPSRQPFPPSP